MWALLATLSVWVGCSSADAGDDASESPGLGTGGKSMSASGGSVSIVGSGGRSDGGVPALPPEQEETTTYTLPVLSGRFVWAANPLSDRVAAIDTRALKVQLSAAGSDPSYLAALRPESGVDSAAIVLNTASRDATLLRLFSADGHIERQRVPTHAGANAWAVSPTGAWAIAWSDANSVSHPDPADSFQDITVIDASSGPSATRLSVGYRPSRLFFDQSESHAYVVSQAGISVVELSHGGSSVLRDVPLSELQRPTDVSITPDGAYAIFRVEQSSRVTLVELESGRRVEITLSGAVTDLDLVADGSAAIAVVRGVPVVPPAPPPAGGAGGADGGGGATSGLADAGAGAAFGDAGGSGGLGGVGANAGGQVSVVGAAGAGGSLGTGGAPNTNGYSSSEVAILPIARLMDEPRAFDHVFLSDLVGSVAVSPDGSEAVLFTNAVARGQLVVLPSSPSDPDYLSPRAVDVHAPVGAVFVAPDASHALVTLSAPEGSSGVGFGIVPLKDELPAQVRASSAPITGVAFAPAPTTSAILTANGGLTAYLVHMPELRVDPVPLLNAPIAAGIVAQERVGYVVQKHPDGQLSLINLDTAEPRTLTGFELAAGVKDGAN